VLFTMIVGQFWSGRSLARRVWGARLRLRCETKRDGPRTAPTGACRLGAPRGNRRGQPPAPGV